MAGYNISIHRVTEDPKYLIKTINTANRITNFTDVVFKLGRNPINATLEIQQDPTTSTYQTLIRANYIVVSGSSGNMTRYYFVTKIDAQPAGKIRYELHEDVLYTWATSIKQFSVTLDRSETIYNGYLPDSDYTALGYRSITCRAFDKGLTTNSFILMTTG